MLDKKLEEYLKRTEGRVYGAGEYLVKERVIAMERINYMEKHQNWGSL